MKRKRKVKKTSFKLIIILLILVFVVIPFTILKMTEDGQYYVEDLSTSEVQASYKHYIFASLKMDTTDSKYTSFLYNFYILSVLPLKKRFILAIYPIYFNIKNTYCR